MPTYTIEGLRFTIFTDSLNWAEAKGAVATFRDEGSEHTDVSIADESQAVLSRGVLEAGAAWKATADTFLVRGAEETCALKCGSQQTSVALSSALDAISEARKLREQRSLFARKTDAGSAELYFHYYGMLQHQQNMLQDYVRTGTYYAAIMENAADFAGRVVMDVGAGSGILSLFAAQAGASKVYAMEASNMADFARMLAAANPAIGSRVEVVKGRVEEVVLQAKVDVLVSEPMGTLLVNERMLETYLYARDHYLKPGGKMFPGLGRIHVAPFSDEALYSELQGKAAFWLQPDFYGVDISCLHAAALKDYFSQVVVDAVDHNVLVAACESRVYDLTTATEAELLDIVMPLNFAVQTACPVHGVACWFDVLFDGSVQPRWLTTAPGQPTTHWFQLRCVLEQPLVVGPGAVVSGELRLTAHSRQSYDVHLTLTAPPFQPGMPPQTGSGSFDLKNPYYRQLTPQPAAAAWDQQQWQAEDVHQYWGQS